MATWYVRPDTSHSGTRNGTSYATAWGGWSEITWGVGGVVGGDTLYICGAHSSATTLTVGAHGGGSGTEAVLRGDYAGDPGSISITAAGQYLSLRSHTNFIDLDMSGVSRVMFAGASTANLYFLGCEFDGGTNPIFGMTAANSTAHSDIRFELCTFNGGSFAATGGGAAVDWFVTATGAVATLDGMSLRYCTFNACNADGLARSVIHLRNESDTDAASVASDLVVEYCTFNNCRGYHIDATDGHSTYGVWTGARITNNVVRGGGENAAGLGGFVTLTGVGQSTTPGFGANKIAENDVRGLAGPAGFCNLIYSSAAVYMNLAEDLSTSTIDACGVLFDIGCKNSTAWSNTFKRLTGKAGVFNSGVGIMVLDAENVSAFGNVVDDALCGILIGTESTTQSCTIANNTFVNIRDYAVYAGASSDLPSCSVKNNVFSGDGYSVYDLSAATWTAEDYNCFYGFASGASDHALGAQSITADPLLDADYRPRSGSPCIDAGTLIDGVVLKDFYGKDITASPGIGAVQRYAARTASASRPAITRSTITRSVHDRRAVCG